MKKTPLLLALIALLSAAGIWLLRSGADEPPPPGRTNEPEIRQPVGDAELAATSNPPPAEVAQDAGIRSPVATRDALVQIPDDAHWIEVLVVEKATGEPVPGATVRWYDATVSAAVDADPGLLGREDLGVRRDTELFASRFGWQTTSDGQGVARVHQTEHTKATARHGELFGRVELGSRLVPPRDGFRIEIEPDAALPVQVLTAAGSPAVGVPVAIAWKADGRAGENLLFWDALASTRSPDGIAMLPHVQTWRDQLPARGEVDLRARTYVPGFEDPGVPFDLDELPDEPLVLTLPPCGTVLVKAELPRRDDAVEIRDFSLTERRPTNNRVRRATARCQPGPDGWARFEHVPVGRTFIARARANGGWLTEQFAGPAADGAEVRVTLSPTEETILLTGRVLDAGRVAVAETPVRLRVRGDVSFDATLTTTAEGRFLAILGTGRKKNEAKEISVACEREGHRPMVARAAPRQLRPGTEDLGDLLLELDSLVVAGECTADGEPCRLPAYSQVERLHEPEGGRSRWRRVDTLQSYTSDDGTFEFYGSPPAGRLRLRVNTSVHVGVEPIEFTRGQRDLEVALQRGAEVSATFLMPRARWQEPIARLSCDDRVRGSRVVHRSDERQQVRWTSLEPGNHTLTVHLRGVDSPIFRLEDVAVPLPAGGDPRLVDIDLRDAVQIQTIRLFDENGEPLARSRGGIFPGGQDPAGDLEGIFFYGSEGRVLLPAGPMTVLVGILDYRPVELRCTGSPIDVRLEPWPKVTLLFPDLPELPEDCRLQAALRPVEASSRVWRARWQTGKVSDIYGPPVERRTVTGGRVELPVGDDAFAVEVSVRNGRRSVAVDVPKVHVRSTTPTVTVPLSPAAVQDALAELAKAK